MADDDPSDADRSSTAGRPPIAAASTPAEAVPPAEPDQPVRIAYGDGPDQFGELWRPAAGTVDDPGEPVAVVVMIHGGFWSDAFGLDLEDPLVPSLLDLGVAVWNIEYRRLGSGGGYPTTFDDVADAIDQLGDLDPSTGVLVDPSRIAVVGHSAGGHLAVWTAGRPGLPPDAVGASPTIRPTLAIAQAGVLDLESCSVAGLGGGACDRLLGRSVTDAADLVAVTSPIVMLPIDVRVVAVHGGADRIVPPSQSERYVEAARAAGTDADLAIVDGEDHFAHLDPDSEAWARVIEELHARLG